MLVRGARGSCDTAVSLSPERSSGGGDRSWVAGDVRHTRRGLPSRVATHRLVAAAWWFPERKRAHCSALHKAMRTVARAPLMPALQPCGRKRRRQGRRLIGRVDRVLALCRHAIIVISGTEGRGPQRSLPRVPKHVAIAFVARRMLTHLATRLIVYSAPPKPVRVANG